MIHLPCKFLDEYTKGELIQTCVGIYKDEPPLWWRGSIVQSKIQFTQTQVKFEFKFGCDNNIGLVEYNSSIGLVWLIVWFG